MSSVRLREAPLRVFPATAVSRPWRSWSGVGGLHLIERHARVYRHAWLILLSGVGEPLFYLFSLGVGLGHLVGAVAGPAGQPIPYVDFVAPALLASSTMNGAITDSTFNVFFRLKYARLYDSALATPMRAEDVATGEIGWALIRGALYAVAFLAVMAAMGLLHSWWAVMEFPASLLAGFAFAAVGMAATTCMRTWQDFDYVHLATMPMFLFSATFYPLAVYPHVMRLVVAWTPLYQAVALMRGLAFGVAGPGLLWHAGYLAAMGLAGYVIAGRRVRRRLLR